MPLRASHAGAARRFRPTARVGGATDDEARLRAFVARNTERLIEALDRNGFYVERIALFLGFTEGRGTYGRADLPEPSAHFEELYPAAIALFEESWRPGAKVNYTRNA